MRHNDVMQYGIINYVNYQNDIRQNYAQFSDINQNKILLIENQENDIQQNDIQQNDIQQNDIQQNDIQQNDIQQNKIL